MLGSPFGHSSQRRNLRTGLRCDPTDAEPPSAIGANLPQQHRPGTTRRITVRGLGVEPESPRALMPNEPEPSHRQTEPPVRPPKRSTRGSMRLSLHDDYQEDLPGNVPVADGMRSRPSSADEADAPRSTRNSMRLSNHADHPKDLPGGVPVVDGMRSRPASADRAAGPRTTRNSMRLSSHATHAEHMADALPEPDGMLTDIVPPPRATQNSMRLSHRGDSGKDGHGALSHEHAELDQPDGEQPHVPRVTRNSMRLTGQPQPTRHLRHHDPQLSNKAADAVQSEEEGTAQRTMSGARNPILKHEDPLFPSASRKARSKLARQLPQHSQSLIPQAAPSPSGRGSPVEADAVRAEPSCTNSPAGQHEEGVVRMIHDNDVSADLAAHAASSSDAAQEEPSQAWTGDADVSFAAGLSGPSAASRHSRRKGKHKPVKGLHSFEPAEKDGRGKQRKRACLNDRPPGSQSRRVPSPGGHATLRSTNPPKEASAAAGPADTGFPGTAARQLLGDHDASNGADAVPGGVPLHDVHMSRTSGSQAREDPAEAVGEAARAGSPHLLEGQEGRPSQSPTAGLQSIHELIRDPEKDLPGALEPPRKSLKIKLKLRSGIVSNEPLADVDRLAASTLDAAPSELPFKGQLGASNSQPAHESPEDPGFPVDSQQPGLAGSASPKTRRSSKRSSEQMAEPSGDAAAQGAAAQAQAEPLVTRSSRRNRKDHGDHPHESSMQPGTQAARHSRQRDSRDRNQYPKPNHEAADQAALPQPGAGADAEGAQQLEGKAQCKSQKRRSREGPAALPDGLAIEAILPVAQLQGQRQTRGASHAANLQSASSSPKSPAKQKREQLTAKPAPRLTRAAARA